MLIPEEPEEPENTPEEPKETLPEDPPELRIELCGEVCTGPPPPPPPEEPFIIKSAKEAFNYRRTFRNRPAARRNTKKRIFA
jgi:hypothetical protein